MDITLVTALYDIRAKEGRDNDGHRTLQDYITLGYSMLDVDLPMVVFTDSREVYTATSKYRMEKGLHEKTLIIWLPFEDTFFYKDLNLLEKRMQEYTIHNLNPDKDTPLYILLNNNKFDFLGRTIAQNPFGSEFFFWMDYGIQHCAKATIKDWESVAQDWPSLIRNDRQRIHQLQIHAVRRNPSQSWKDYCQTIYHHVGGGCFGGYKDPVNDYIDLFKAQWDTILKEGWYQLDEAVMTIITETHPEKFRFWYGDYDGFITNFIVSKRSWHLCFNLCQHYLDKRDYIRSEAILITLDPVMISIPPKDQSSFFRYISLRITHDFYYYEKNFSPALSNLLLTYPSIIPPTFLETQVKNLLYYKNKDAMRFFALWSLYDPENSRTWKEWGIFRTNDMKWIPIGGTCLSTLILDQHGRYKTHLPLDLVHCEPHQAIALFREQFSDFYPSPDVRINRYGIDLEPLCKKNINIEQEIQTLYQELEISTVPIVFLHTTERFLSSDDKDQYQKYDEDLIELAGFIERNFPNLQFCMLILLINRPFHGHHPRILPICMKTPLGYTSNDQLDYRNAVFEWFGRIIV